MSRSISHLSLNSICRDSLVASSFPRISGINDRPSLNSTKVKIASCIARDVSALLSYIEICIFEFFLFSYFFFSDL